MNYVLLAGCSEVLNEKYGIFSEQAFGRILSIYDVEDEKFGSCKEMLIQSPQLFFKEIELDTGKGHKLFQIPKEKFIEQWRDPHLEWTGNYRKRLASIFLCYVVTSISRLRAAFIVFKSSIIR